MRCIACESENLVEGYLMGGDGQPISFISNDRGLWRKILGIGSRTVSAMACLHCGNLQHQVQFTDDDRKRLATFDGPQESIVESLIAELEPIGIMEMVRTGVVAMGRGIRILDSEYEPAINVPIASSNLDATGV